jgi:hypothetical protein
VKAFRDALAKVEDARGAMPEVRQLENDPKQITVITQFRERYLEGVVCVEQRMLEDAREGAKDGAQDGVAKQLPTPDAEGEARAA